MRNLIRNVFKNKIITEVYSDYKLLRILILKRNKEILDCKVYLLGILSFDIQIYENDLVKLQEYISLYQRDISKPFDYIDSLDKISPKIQMNEFPFAQIITILTSSIGNNLIKFYEEMIITLDGNPEISDLIILNLQEQREKYLDYFNYLYKHPINRVLFPNNAIRNKVNNFKHIQDFVSLETTFFKFENYANISSFDELYNYVTENKNIVFKKDLQTYLRENLILTQFNKSDEKFNFFNLILCQKIKLICSLNKSEEIKSLKEFKFYLEKLNKIELSFNSAFITKSIDLNNNLYKFLNMFKEEPLEVLKKTNIPYFLIKDNINLLETYYKKSDVLSVKKEKKLYYFLQNLSKRVAQDISNFKLENKNENLNNDFIDYKQEDFHIKTIEDFTELYNLGIKLNVCAGNFETISTYKTVYNIVVTEKDKIYLMYIKNGFFKEFKGYKNSKPSYDLFLKVYNYLYNNGYLKEESEYKIKSKNKKDTFLKSLYEQECIHKIYIK